ncbi:MAG: hypothetical protein GX281_04810 [Bacteroidales bacterium]|jgi:UDP-3-O-[3-hydroxymyristoyl] N-acetylglucosamine deacetylase/3-hydroxyacyl-[acyl-carrier-protein] dehydratase|nr:UDP-3-O-acyl-N-acetylglucosamine deacetylase [Bacteroidales bacterium]NLK80019.1 hypothetical protein [Bacteroidales bacterium]HKM31843.1 UDP-3-O-acyl-N-acetylglucosamine deacetylase [Bacteroidales bacterium]
MKQQTIRREITFKGTGLHTGHPVEMHILPAPEGYGICFQRTDVQKQPVIPAQACYVAHTNRSTVLALDGAEVGTTEHLLAALYGMGIDNAHINLNGPEVPILDGSAWPFALALKDTGVVVQQEERTYFTPQTPIFYEEKDTGTSIIVIPAPVFSVGMLVDFTPRLVGKQGFYYSSAIDFLQDLAPARTFVFLDEVLPLLKKGLIKGGDMDNALVIADQEVDAADMRLLQMLFKDSARHLHTGYINKEGLRFPNECARHKTVDLLGDLMLAGKRLHALVAAHKPGHKANVAVARMIRNQCLDNESSAKI